MSEFRIHHDVNELLSLLRVRGGDGAEVYIDLLQKNRTPYVTTTVSAHSAKVKIAEYSKTPEDFLKKYDELKSRNVRNLDPLVYLLSKLTEDKETLQYLQQNAKDRADLSANATASSTTSFHIPQTSAKMSIQELEELRKKLGNVTASSNLQQPLEITRKMLRDKHNKKNPLQPIPVFPNWVYERPALIGDFITVSSGSTDTTVPIDAMALAAQELALVEDLLYLLIGVDGRYITAQPVQGRQNRSFTVDPTLDMSIKELVNRILPVAASYSTISRFIEEKSSFEYGQVNHALAAGMRTLMKEYMILVTQLEHLQRQGMLSLQKLWFYIQPTMRTMEILASLATSVDKGDCMGGSTLSLLHDRTFNYTGDSQAQELCLYLTKASSVPYFEILEKWIYRGIIKDPYSEFMVEEHELQKEKIQEDYNDKYWDQRYTVVQHRIPAFLQKMADKILSKYLNVVRECGRDVTCPEAKEILYTLKERAYVEQIEKAYNYASKVLLNFLMEEKELVARLRSIKHYFLMDQGDFFVSFMDLTEEELKKPVDDIIPTRLEALLELALRMSTANTDPFKDDLKIDLMPHDVITQLLRVLAIETKQEKAVINADPTEIALSGLEAFSFDYIVKWPLSLIINRKALTRYQMLFRHMFYCKHVERLLCNVWISNKNAKQYSLHSAKWFAGAFTLRQRMLNFVQNIQYYMMFEVMEPTWHIMENNLKSASNIDDVLCHHTSFLDNCLKDCMLTNPELLKIFSKLMSVCVMFTNCMQRFTQSMKLDGEMSRLTLEHGTMRGPPTQNERTEEAEKKKLTSKYLSEHVDALQSAAGFEGTINKFDSNFSTHLLDLLDRLSVYSTNDCEHSMINIIYRLDFNGFYTERLERMSAERSQKVSYPEKVQYALTIEGKNYTINLEKNRILLGKDYTETHFLQNGTEITSSPNVEEHCFYQGHIQGVKDSSISISTCSGIRGLLMVEQKVYLLEPLSGAAEGAHAVYRQEHLRMKRATCRDSNETVYDHGPKLAGIFKTPTWKSAPLAKGNRFVEMFLVVDNREYTKYNKDMQEIRSRMLEVVNHVDKLYRPVNVRVVLVGLEVWTYRDKFVVNTDPDQTLSHFLAWRKTDLLKKKKHDNAQFVTGISFEGSTVGLATKFAMCSGDSGAVNEDHNRNPIGVASTIAHEMGHNLGMSHDDSDCICEASKSRKGCIMADSIGNIYPHSFSSCSQQALQQFLSQYNPSCLLNTPSTDDLYGGPVCGNDFVEQGEECDCGTVEECRNPCCNATTCRLKEGAQCAHGECCHDCKVKPAGDVCRHSESDCDLPEYCTGLNPQCPENAFQMNGSPCKFGQGYCFNGECPTHQQHCITLWGPAARVAPDPCFQQNKRGDEHAHCKKNLNGYQSCAGKDIKCGKIHCQDGNMFPITKQKYTMTLPWAVQCKIAKMSNDADSEDLGLVPNGTKCEEGKVCYNGRCQDLDIYETEDCSAKCNNHGVCNHKKECHCDAGWSPPYCDVKLSELPKGGNAIIIGVTVAVVLLILASLITSGLMFCRRSRKESFPSKTKEKSGLSNPLFQRGGNKGSPHVGTPTISRPIFLESSSVPQLCTPLCVTVIPSRPPPQVSWILLCCFAPVAFYIHFLHSL
ncbi:GCP2 protein, partial [Polyodon spathula]|nr:GCP2 protein [Polyodon spathula]